ncbi:EamA family transporter [Streptomyces angustmyceticus]|uniref:Membrane protein n=1 Tax=Streptomyces angustmyceticus TaxID=285578 RepID=A0A5J4LE86_9ACTN|nr:EamA family transporter [Streptomyces angustmyceticus]UAL65119.1 EamA family transporter [Streptomyces angustmyceticus]GES28445.1 membrane protein [Streptomyces angustmyceticus]
MRPAHLALAVLVAAVWGVNFTVVEIGLSHFPPLLFSALRFLTAAIPAVFLVRRPVAWKWIVGVGLVLGVAKFGLLFVAMDTGMPAGLSSLVLQAQAVFTAVIAFVVLGERPSLLGGLGMAVALAGIAVAAVDEDTSGGPLGAFALCVAAAACWGASNVLTRKAAPPDALGFMVWVSTIPVLPLLALSVLFEGPSRDVAALRTLDWQGAGTVLYVAWITTVFGFGAWGWLLRRHPASTVAPFSLLVPVFGMSSAALFLGEPVSALRWCAAVLLVGGVALTSLAPRHTPPAPAARPANHPAQKAAVSRP